MKKIVGCIVLVALNLLVLGCSTQLSSEDLMKMQTDCESNIFHGLSFIAPYEDRQKPLVVQHIKDGKLIEEFTVLSDEDYSYFYFTKKAIHGNDTYLLKINSKEYVLTELKGDYNSRCHMFGCNPACAVDSYKINSQKKSGMDIDLRKR